MIETQASLSFSRRMVMRVCLAALTVAAIPPSAARSASGGERIVSIGGSLTEIAFALGAGPRLVGADTTSTWPPEAEALEKVGYMRRLSAEGILSLRPDIVIAHAKSGPDTVIDQLTSAGVRILIAPDLTGLSSVVPKIRFVAEALSLKTQGERLVSTFESRMRALDTALNGVDERPRVAFLMSFARGAPMGAGSETAAEALILEARGANALAGISGYKPVSAESLIEASPDYVLLPSHALEDGVEPASILRRPDLANTPAGRNGRVVVMDSLKLLGFGIRTPEAIAELARAIHPDIALGIPE